MALTAEQIVKITRKRKGRFQRDKSVDEIMSLVQKDQDKIRKLALREARGWG